MSDCIRNCRLCDRMILSQSIAFAGGNLVVDLPTNQYENGAKYCIVLAQTIPEAVTINAPVVFTINGGATQYPFVNQDGTAIQASQVRTRRLYLTRVNTGVNSGVFRYVGTSCLPSRSSTFADTLSTETTTTPAE